MELVGGKLLIAVQSFYVDGRACPGGNGCARVVSD